MVAKGWVVRLRLPDLVFFGEGERGDIVQVSHLFRRREAGFRKFFLIKIRVREQIFYLLSIAGPVQRKLLLYRARLCGRVENGVILH